jgi:hypothetical protein
MMERLAELENRLSALERAPAMTFTPFSLDVGNSTMSYTWRGGKLWIVHGGWCVAGGGVGAGTIVGLVVRWQSPVNTFFTPTVACPSGGNAQIALPMMITDAGTPLSVPGTYTLQTLAFNGNTTNWLSQGALIEWSQ